MYREESKFLPYVLLRYSKPRCGCISLLYAKSRRKKYLNLFVSSKKSRTFASRLLSNCTKSLVLSTLLHHVSVVTMLVRLVFELLINLIFKQWIL